MLLLVVVLGAQSCTIEDRRAAPASTPADPRTSPTVSPVVPSQTPTRTSPPPTPTPERDPEPPPALARGDSGSDVAALQRRLEELRYWVGPKDGSFGHLTEQAVYAFQAYERLPVTGEVDDQTRRRLERADVPVARSGSGDIIEVDRTRQLLLVVRDGAVEWVLNTSTGSFERYRHPDGHWAMADTPAGRWDIDWQVDGWREGDLGAMWRPKYFHRDGLAIHGYERVPPPPVSHGCVRVSIEAMDLIWRQDYAPVGSVVWVYGAQEGAPAE